VIEWINEVDRIGGDDNNTQFESERARENWVRDTRRDIEEFKAYVLGNRELSDKEVQDLQCNEFTVGYCGFQFRTYL
jgi:hypothetical protein